MAKCAAILAVGQGRSGVPLFPVLGAKQSRTNYARLEDCDFGFSCISNEVSCTLFETRFAFVADFLTEGPKRLNPKARIRDCWHIIYSHFSHLLCNLLALRFRLRHASGRQRLSSKSCRLTVHSRGTPPWRVVKSGSFWLFQPAPVASPKFKR